MSSKKYKIGIIALHPVQYHSPLYEKIAASPLIDAGVIYLDTVGLEGVYDKQFGQKVVWDIPLLGGYKYEFVKNYARSRLAGFLCRINPGLFNVLRKGSYDAILIQGYSTFSYWLALLSAKILNIKIIWRGETILRPEVFERTPARWLLNATIRWFLERCDAVMYSCHGNRRLLETMGVPAQRLFPFPAAVDNAWFQKQHALYQDERKQIKAAIGIAAANMVLMYCGSLNPNKRIMDVLKAVELAGAIGISVLMVGNGPLWDEAASFGKRKGIDLHMVGFVNQSQIAKYYSIADVLIIVSERDNSPKVLNEALNFEIVPIVSDGVGTAKDLVIEGESGYVVKVGDIRSIADRLTILRDDPHKRRAMGNAAKAVVERNNFDADVEGLLLACRSILNGCSE